MIKRWRRRRQAKGCGGEERAVRELLQSKVDGEEERMRGKTCDCFPFASVPLRGRSQCFG